MAVGNRQHVLVKEEVLDEHQMTEPSKKATNKDLPPGAKPDYRRVVVPTIWHWAAGNVADPFNINENEMVQALAVIWKHVYYGNNVPFTKSTVPTIVRVVR